MFRIVPPEENEFKERFKRKVWDFIMEEGLNWNIATHSSVVDDSLWAIANELWYIKQHVSPEDTDIMNSREGRKEWEKVSENDS
jgi:hypothetical protein